MAEPVLSKTIEADDDGIISISHNLHALDHFYDDALAGVIDRHPEEFLDICVEGSFSTCRRNGFTGTQLIEAVKLGKFWLNLRNIDQIDHDIGHMINDLHDQSDAVLGRKGSSRIGGLLISSPSASVGYHFDLTDVTLWHIRGQKRIYIYPDSEPFIMSEDIQNVVLAEGVEKIPYNPEFDKAAKAYDLEPGQMISWPHLSPHRVENVSGLNVSLSLESLSLQSRFTIGAHFFDAFLRSRLNMSLFAQSDIRAIQIPKAVLAVLIRKAGLTRAHHAGTYYKYDLDKNFPGFLKPNPPTAE